MMEPTDPADAHLTDRAIELRVLKSGVVAFAIAVASIFVSLAPVFLVFALAYLAYKYSYYSNRIGVFARDDRAVQHRRLELGLLATGIVTAVVLVLIQNLFAETWTLGGFLSLPSIDFTNPDALLGDPLVPVAWAIVLAPVVAISYAGLQFRYRLLFGLDSHAAAVRATVWESLARLPVYLLWIAVLTVQPVYEVYAPVVGLVGESLGLTVGTNTDFAIVLGDAFSLVVVDGLAGPLVVIGTYIGIQRWKYDDATVPEVLGYPGLAPPTRRSHPANIGGPIAVYLLYTLAVATAIGSLPIFDLGLLLAVLVSVGVGANVLGKTTTLSRSVSQTVADNVDAVTTGLVVGVVALFVFDLLGGSVRTGTELALTYPIVAAPLTQFANWRAGQYAVEDISEFIEQTEAGEDEVDTEIVDRLFVYSRAWDDTLRATATDGLATLVPVTSYRREDAIGVFVEAVESDHPEIARTGLRGIAMTLREDPTRAIYERLIDAGCREFIVAHLDSHDQDEATRARAVEAAARLFAIGLDTTDPPAGDHPTESRIDRMIAVAKDESSDRAVAGAVVEYVAAALTVMGESGEDVFGPPDEVPQLLLGGLLRLIENVDEPVRQRAVTAVTSGNASADDERFSLAVDQLESETAEARQLAARVVRYSMEGRTDQLDSDDLVGLLEDPSAAVRREGAQALESFVQFAPDRAPGLLDRFILHLQENQAAPDQTEASLLRALVQMDVDELIDHPTAAKTVAEYVNGSDPPIGEPAAEVLSAMVEADPGIASEDVVGAAIEAGLTHESGAVRLRCLAAVVAIVEDSTEEGRRFVDGLGANLGTEGDHGRLAVVCLAEVLESIPETGLEILPGLANGLRNLTPIDRQTVPFGVRGATVSAVTVDILGAVVPLEPARCEILIEPLADLGTSADGATLEGVLGLLAPLSAEFPAECRSAVGIAAAVLEDDRVGIRQAASEVLANVAAHDPRAVEPFVDRLVVATDDDSHRVRAAVLVALRNVSAAAPAAVEADIHRVVGLLDDDSVAVRERAAHLIVVIAEQAPEIIEPAAETADRLRRLQHDPAVDFDPERLQNASNAIRTGVPVPEANDTAEEATEEIWSPETADEMGVSGDTEVFEPAEDEFDAPAPIDAAEEPSTGTGAMEDVEDLETAVEPDDAATGDDPTKDVEDLETAVGAREAEHPAEDATSFTEDTDEVTTPAREPQERDAAGDAGKDEESGIAAHEDTVTTEESTDAVEDRDTVIGQSDTASEEVDDGDVQDMETAIGRSDDKSEQTVPEDVGDRDTVIGRDDDTPGDPDDGDVEDLDTAIGRSDETSGPTDTEDVGDRDTVIGPGDDIPGDPDDGDVENLETAIGPSEDTSEQTVPEEVEDLDTVIGQSDEATHGADTEDVEDLDTAVGQSEDSSEAADAGDVEDLETVIEPEDEEPEESDDSSADSTDTS